MDPVRNWPGGVFLLEGERVDGICEVIENDPEVTWEVGDRVYRLSMLTIVDWAAITNEVKKLRPDPIAVGLRIVAGLETRDDKAQVLQMMWAEARRSQVVPEREVGEWTTTAEGSSFCLWRALLNHHPKITLEEVRANIRPVAEAGRGLSHVEIVDLVNQVHGMPPSGPT